jgi:hypothetical protein
MKVKKKAKEIEKRRMEVSGKMEGEKEAISRCV